MLVTIMLCGYFGLFSVEMLRACGVLSQGTLNPLLALGCEVLNARLTFSTGELKANTLPCADLLPRSGLVK